MTGAAGEHRRATHAEDVDARLAALERRLAQLEGAGAGAEWASQAAAARIAGCSPGTIRRWLRSGLLTRGRRGRVNLAELRALLAGSERPQQVADMATERARRAAAAILAGNRG